MLGDIYGLVARFAFKSKDFGNHTNRFAKEFALWFSQL